MHTSFDLLILETLETLIPIHNVDAEELKAPSYLDTMVNALQDRRVAWQLTVIDSLKMLLGGKRE
jgi:hypothetical protein